MQREGSALHGLGVVILKELSDHLTSVRMRVLEWLVVLFALAALYGAIQQIRETTAEDPFLSLSLIALWLLVIGLGLFLLGLPPSGEELARAFIFLFVTIAYAGVWLALA